MKKFLALAALVGLVSTPALAADAQLGSVKGDVLVNGKASTGALKAGDRVVAAKGSAQIKFADGCVVGLKANSMVTIASKSPCAKGAGVVSATSATPAQGMLGDATPLQLLGTAVVLTAVVIGGANVLDNTPDSISE